MRGIRIKGYKELTKNKEVIIADAKYVYIPIYDADIKVRRGSNVLIGSTLAIHNEMPVLSSVSGKVIDFEEKLTYKGITNTVKIENDFKNKYKLYEEYKEDLDYTKEEFVNLLKHMNVIGMGGAGFPTYIKYEADNLKYLVVNAVECSPFITADYVLMKENIDYILDTIDDIIRINNLKKAYFAIKKIHKELIKEIKTKLKEHKNIKLYLVPDIYPAGWEKNLVSNIIKGYDRLPSEVATVVNNVTTILAIGEALHGRYMPRRLVTFAGDGIKKNHNVSALIGQDISFILDTLGHKKRNMLLIIDGPMLGKTIDSNEFIITSNINSILMMKENDDEKIYPCVRCGKCTLVCPAKLSPILIKENMGDIKMLKKLHADKCIECGLCSYICPSKILLKEQVITAKKNVRDKDEA